MGEGFQSDIINCRQTYGFIWVLGWGVGWGKGFRVTKSHCQESQQASIRSGDNISEASKLLHLPRKTHGKGHKLSRGSQAIRK